MKFKRKGVLEKSIVLLQHALISDKELPVKVEAAIAIQMLLTEQDKGQSVRVTHGVDRSRMSLPWCVESVMQKSRFSS